MKLGYIVHLIDADEFVTLHIRYCSLVFSTRVSVSRLMGDFDELLNMEVESIYNQDNHINICLG